MRTCPTNATLLIAYINGTYQEARNPRDSLLFVGDHLQSYKSVLARIDRTNKVLCINHNLVGYSVTTTAHISSLRGFCSNYQIFIVPFGKQPLQVIKWYWECIEELIPKYLRSITKKEIYKSDIHELISKVESYVDYMQLDRSSEEYMYKTEITRQLFKHKLLKV